MEPDLYHNVGALVSSICIYILCCYRLFRKQKLDLLERLSQEEALLHVVVGGVGGVDVLHPGETATHPTVLVNGLEGVEEREGGAG